MKHIAIFSLLSIAINLCDAQEPETYMESFFNLVNETKYSEAIGLLPLSKDLESDTTFFRKTFEAISEGVMNSGEYCGFELIEKEEIAPSLITFSYLIKYLNAPQQMQITFYKPKEEWQVNRLVINNTAGRRPARRQSLRR